MKDADIMALYLYIHIAIPLSLTQKCGLIRYPLTSKSFKEPNAYLASTKAKPRDKLRQLREGEGISLSSSFHSNRVSQNDRCLFGGPFNKDYTIAFWGPHSKGPGLKALITTSRL